MVPFPSKCQRDGSYIPSGLSGRELWPCARKKFILSYLLLSSRPRVYRSLGKSLERPFSRPSFLFFLDYSVSLLRVENSRTRLPVLDFSFCRQSLRSVFLHQDWQDFFGVLDKYSVRLDFSSFSCKYRNWVHFAAIAVWTSPFSGSGRSLLYSDQKVEWFSIPLPLFTLEPQLVRKFQISGSHGLARPPKKTNITHRWILH
jgi:hypothetical protein